MRSISWLFIFEAVVIVTGNVITIVIFTTTPRLRSRQYALIVSLAVADLLVGLVSVPVHIVSTEDIHTRQTIAFYYFYVIQDGFLGSASLFGLAALAIERAHATYYPFKHSTLSTVPYIVGITVVWVSATAIAFGSVYTITKVITIAISLVTIAAAYLLIFVKTRCQATATHHAIQQSNKKLTITLAIVTSISLITWIPYKTVAIYVMYCPQCFRQLSTVRHVTKFLHFSNSLANFIVYAFRMREFKIACMRRMPCFNTNQISNAALMEFPKNSERSAATVGRSKTSIVAASVM